MISTASFLSWSRPDIPSSAAKISHSATPPETQYPYALPAGGISERRNHCRSVRQEDSQSAQTPQSADRAESAAGHQSGGKAKPANLHNEILPTCTMFSFSEADFMTATWLRLDYDLLDRVSSRIGGRGQHVNCVLYYITSKPPATIALERNNSS
jgi:hypothetical protein